MNIDSITSIKNIIINGKVVDMLFNPAFFMLLGEKFFEIFPKHNGYCFISEFFALN